ncbi:serine hydrolase domain-containing protein [Motilibacter aurantiacus]|uniref:serine hydrolase domain-containing protein n=1 Tax=Motilibacter aurantiacus TaxID=2714955 RepID=UPI00140C0F10|nr:serine hydrolase domain-containing protein [Motilibacter aurantiacus]NHC45657.1 beta-lactamase family protein [Motilibacter aurantiacus]
MRPDVEARLLARAARAQAEGRVPSLTAGVVQDGELTWSAGRGVVDGSRPDADVQYRIGSITKTLTAVLVMRLRDEGLLRLDDPVERLAPGTPFGQRTVAQLLAHTSGITAESPGLWWERTAGGDWEALAAATAAHDVKHAAGTRFHYSNLGYGVLGRVVEGLRGRSWAGCVRAEILEPLGMRRTSTMPEAPAAPGLAVHPWADLVLPEPGNDHGAMAPAGQLWSTVEDLARYARVFLGAAPEVLSPATVQEMSVPGGVDERPSGWSAYGLGLQVHRDADGRTLIGHGGSMPGFLASFLVDPAERTASVVLANTTAGLDMSIGTDLLATLRELDPYVVPEWAPATDAPEAVLELLGLWHWGPAPLALRLLGDGMLELVAFRGRGRESRFRREGQAWRGLDGYYAGETLRAVRREDGSVSHLDLATFVLTRGPYAPDDVQPGGIEPPGWRTSG